MTWIVARKLATYNRPVAILAGIDEAGYGPTLGPLVVSATAFQVPDGARDRCLWKTLAHTCTPSVTIRDRRLAVADSKRIYKSRTGSFGLALLERTALVMLNVAGHRPTTWRQMLRHVAPHAIVELDDYAWYSGSDAGLPISSEVGDVATRANAIRRDCSEHDVTLCGVFCEPLTEGHFNNRVRATRNKAVVLLGLVLQLVDRVMRFKSDDLIRICVDRLGGRHHYRESLTTAFPDHELQILEESPERSAYRLMRKTQVCDLEFVTEGEGSHFAIALASIYSKYLREIYMKAFNGYWSHHATGLRPTAGYYTDAQRWLREVAPLLDQLSVDRSVLIRDR